MSKYGQYCPIAQALEVLGDRWTMLIVRDMLTGTRHFNDLERGLPGISRGLLAKRLRQLQEAGVIEKRSNGSGRQTTEYCMAAIVIALFTLLVLPPLVQQTNNVLRALPNAIETIVGEYTRIRSENEFLTSALPPFTPEDYQNLLNAQGGPPMDAAVLAESALPLLANIGGFVGNIIVNLFLIFFISIYFVLDPLVYYRILVAIVPAERETRAIQIVNTIRDTVVTWLGAMVLEVGITAVLVVLALLVLGVPNAIALGTLAGLGNIVPYIGYWAALLPIVIIAAATKGPLIAVLAFAAYFIIGIVEANIILPANVGSKLKLPAGLVLLFQAAAGALLGFWGVLLAVPILAILMVLTRELVVFDALGKRGRIPQVQESPEGHITLEYPVEEAEPEAPAGTGETASEHP